MTWAASLLLATALLALAACAPSPAPLPDTATRAQRVAALPETNLDMALEAFAKVCDASAPRFADWKERWRRMRGGQAFLFDAGGGKQPFCSMTARDDPDRAWRMMKLRFGLPRYVSGGMFVFDRRSNRQLLYQVACQSRGCPERGTYQLAIVPGRTF